MKIIMGYVGLFGIIILIAGPLLLFSTFNPISESNPILNAKIDFNILIQSDASSAINAMSLYSNNYVTSLEPISTADYKAMLFDKYPMTKGFEPA